jgi:MHS family alpha-ketoglutarate permease-like MFS transporter
MRHFSPVSASCYCPRMAEGSTPSTAPPGPTRAETSTGRAVLNTLKGSAGNLVEWYDVYIYTVFATYFEAQFFDPDDANSTLYIYAIFAVTFIMRPAGSWFFGRYADRRGRKAALVLSISVMSCASFLVAIMPTREVIGAWAAVILVLARLVQGFATGGEYGTSATYMSEAATTNRRGFLSSFQYVTLVGGHVLAQFTLLILLSFLDVEAVSDWGWRVGFFIGGIAALVVLWIRRTMDETLSESHLEAIREGKDPAAGSLRALFTTHWRPLLLVFLITAGGTVAFYTYSVNAPAIIKSTIGADRALTATWINLLGLIFLMLLQPVGGLISDRVGRKPLLVFFGVGGVLYTYVLLTFLPQTTSPLAAFALTAVGYVILTGYTSINAIVKAELFPADFRALGVGMGYAVANSVFGGTAPLLFQAAKSGGQDDLFIIYVTVVIGVSLLVYIFGLKNKAITVLDREQGSAWAVPAASTSR